MAIEITTAEMDRWIWLQVKPTMGESALDDDTKAKLLAIAARLSALDKELTAAPAYAVAAKEGSAA